MNTKPLLADLFLIFGLQNVPLRKSSIGPLKPEIIDYYPKPNPLPSLPSLEMICFPEGFRMEEINETTIKMQLQVIHFTVTDGAGKRRFATALSFSEVLDAHNDSINDSLDTVTYSVPKTFCLISSYPLFELHK